MGRCKPSTIRGRECNEEEAKKTRGEALKVFAEGMVKENCPPLIPTKNLVKGKTLRLDSAE
ncbi:9656_t:CDS:1, partial [Acaulospora colombiana]